MKQSIDSGTIGEQTEHRNQRDPLQISRLREKTDKLIASGQIDDALVLQEQILAIDPTDNKALASKADLLAAIGRYDDALSCYDKTLVRDPQNVSILRNKALVLSALHRPNEALAYWNTVLAANPADAATLRNKGDSLLELKRYRDAMACYEQAAAENMGAFQAQDWTVRGDKLYQSREYVRAAAFYDKAIKADPKHFWAWRGKGLVLSALPKKERQALHCIDRALEIKPDNAELWVEKGSIFFDQQKYADAVHCYEKAAGIDTEDFNAWYNKGVALERLGKFRDAITALDRAIKIDPNHVDAWVEKGFCLTSGLDHNYKESVKCSERAISLDPDSLWAWNNKGWALYKLKEFKAALKALNAAINIVPGETIPWNNKSKCLLEMGKPGEALRCLKESLLVADDRHAALTNLGLFYSESLYRHKRALQVYEEALKLIPEDAMTKANIAECLVKLGRYREGRKWAVEIVDQLADSPTDQCAAKYIILVSYALSGDTKNRGREFAEFLDFLNQAEGRRPEDDPTWDFRGLINTIVNSKADAETKFLLLTGIDLQQRKLSRDTFTFFDKARSRKNPTRESKQKPARTNAP